MHIATPCHIHAKRVMKSKTITTQVSNTLRFS